MSNTSLPEKHTIINPYRLSGGVLIALGAGLTMVAAMSMDGGGAVLPLVVSGLSTLAAGAAVLLAAKRIEEAERERDEAEVWTEANAGYDGCTGCESGYSLPPDCTDGLCQIGEWSPGEEQAAHEDAMWAIYKEEK